jgi:hypothetical protein
VKFTVSDALGANPGENNIGADLDLVAEEFCEEFESDDDDLIDDDRPIFVADQ